MSEANPRAEELLAARARNLARPLDAARTAAPGNAGRTSLLVVKIGDERVAIALDHIIEVHRRVELTPIPGARPPVAGAIAWRGRVLTVLDVAPVRRGALTTSDSTRMIVIGQRRAVFGIVVDDVESVEDLDMKDAVAVADLQPTRRELVRGVTRDAVVVLDVAALIARFAPTN